MAVPRESSRESTTPCQSGVTYATCSSTGGSCSTGKNTPPKRNSGVTTKRNSAAKPASLSLTAAKATTGAENAMPVSTAAGSASSASGESRAPKSPITARKIAEPNSTRLAM